MVENAVSKLDNNRYRAIGMQAAAAALWSIGGVLIKLVNLPALEIVGIRSLLTAIVVFAFIKKFEFKLTVNIIGGAVSYTLMVMLYVSSTKMTTAANAILLQYTSPIYIALFGGWLLHEKATKNDWITILFMGLGMMLFFLDDLKGGSIKGSILAILSGVAMAFNTIFLRRQKDEDPMENVFWGSILTVICTLPFMFRQAPSPKSWIGLILLGVFQLGFSYVLYAKAIKHITALESTFISLIEPILNPVWVLLIIGEKPGKFAILGGAIVMISIIVSCMKTDNSISKEGQI